MRPDVVVAGEQVAGVVLTLDHREAVVDLCWINRGDILLGGRGEEVCVGAVDVGCESRPDRFQSRASSLDDRLRIRTLATQSALDLLRRSLLARRD